MKTLYFYRDLKTHRGLLSVLDLTDLTVVKYHTSVEIQHEEASLDQESLELAINENNAVVLTEYKDINYNRTRPKQIDVDELAKKITSGKQALKVFDILQRHGCELYQAKPAKGAFNSTYLTRVPFEPTADQFANYVIQPRMIKKISKSTLKL